MSFEPGLVHAPLTPFTAGGRIDWETYAGVIQFHLANGADAIAVPMHSGEAVSLPDREKREIITFAVNEAGGVPVLAHASDSGTGIAAALARFAEAAGATAIITTTPYYWTPPAAMLVEHFAEVAGAVSLPFYAHNAPDDMAGIKVSVAIALELIDRAPNFIGVVDSGLDWQFMLELITEAPRKRPGFQLISGNEYMVSAGSIGATGLVSTLAAIAPQRVRALYDDCRADRLFEARKAQEDLAALRQVVKASGVAGLKAAARAMGRDMGAPRPPLKSLEASALAGLQQGLDALSALSGEPRGW
jgi:4-hydroxy-tetrahydrodipicolinate synthase